VSDVGWSVSPASGVRRPPTVDGWEAELVHSEGEPEPDWLVDVVLRAAGRESTQLRLVESVAAVVTRGRRPPTSTGSFDMAPPDGSLGVSCWVRATSAGRAADLALTLVTAAATKLTGVEHQLWDLRVIPGAAVDETQDAVGGPENTHSYWRR
jgi:hypothetical protein